MIVLACMFQFQPVAAFPPLMPMIEVKQPVLDGCYIQEEREYDRT
jgi:hypothetical protein